MRSSVFLHRPLLALLGGLLLLIAAGWGGVHSDLFIEPGQQFVLGGGQRGAFKVAAHNVGKVTVEVQEQTANGTITNKGTLKPKQKTMLRFAAGSAAVLRNAGTGKANLALHITGESGLNMSTGSM